MIRGNTSVDSIRHRWAANRRRSSPLLMMKVIDSHQLPVPTVSVCVAKYRPTGVTRTLDRMRSTRGFRLLEPARGAQSPELPRFLWTLAL